MNENANRLNVVSMGDLPQRTADAYLVHISKIFDEDPQPVQFLVEGCIPRNCIVVMTGESGVGKSFLAYDLARAVTMGGRWMNRAPALAAPETVLILNYDNPTNTLKSRIMQMGFERSAPCYVHTQGMTKPLMRGVEMLRLPDEQTRLKYLIQVSAPSLILFDSMRQGQTMNENDNQDMGKLMAIFKSWTEMPSKPAVVVLHHTSKNTQNSTWTANARGSGEIVSSADVVLEATGDKEKRATGTLTWTKNRGWPIGTVSSCAYTIVDKYDGDDEGGDDEEDELGRLKTFVNATSVLPGENERAVVDKVVRFIGSRPKYTKVTTIEELVKATGLAKGPLKEALLRARSQGRVTFRKNGKMRGYALA